MVFKKSVTQLVTYSLTDKVFHREAPILKRGKGKRENLKDTEKKREKYYSIKRKKR